MTSRGTVSRKKYHSVYIVKSTFGKLTNWLWNMIVFVRNWPCHPVCQVLLCHLWDLDHQVNLCLPKTYTTNHYSQHSIPPMKNYYNMYTDLQYYGSNCSYKRLFNLFPSWCSIQLPGLACYCQTSYQSYMVADRLDGLFAFVVFDLHYSDWIGRDIYDYLRQTHSVQGFLVLLGLPLAPV